MTLTISVDLAGEIPASIYQVLGNGKTIGHRDQGSRVSSFGDGKNETWSLGSSPVFS